MLWLAYLNIIVVRIWNDLKHVVDLLWLYNDLNYANRDEKLSKHQKTMWSVNVWREKQKHAVGQNVAKLDSYEANYAHIYILCLFTRYKYLHKFIHVYSASYETAFKFCGFCKQISINTTCKCDGALNVLMYLSISSFWKWESANVKKNCVCVYKREFNR